jgi:hypothetical protein
MLEMEGKQKQKVSIKTYVNYVKHTKTNKRQHGLLGTN